MAGLLGIEATSVAASSSSDASAGLDQAKAYLKYESQQGVVDFTHASAKTPEPYATCLGDNAVTACSDAEIANIEASKVGVRKMQADYIQFLVNHLTSGE
jgi:precorrin-6x reductase